VGDGIDYPKFNGFRIRISHENCTFWRYDPNLNRPSGYSTRQPNLSNTKVVQQQTWRCELWANCTKMEVWIDPGVFLTHLWKPWISLIKVWASKLQHTGDVEKASIWQGRCIAQLLWIELLQIQRGNGTSPMYKWFTMIYLLTKMTIVHCYVKLPEAIMNVPDILMSLWWNWWNTPASWPPSWMFLRKVTQDCFFSSCSFWIL